MSSPGYPAAGLALFPQAAARPPSGRAKLWTLPSLYFCSILGTCLTSLELRKLVAQRLGMATRESTDLAVHEQAVEAAGRADAGGRELHRALESKYQETIKRFERAKTPQLIHHDGGVEDRRGLLRGLITRADLVVFPVDCVGHDAAGTLKRFCGQAAKPYRPLRTASVASFLAAIRDGQADERRPVHTESEPPRDDRCVPPRSHFCLRHG